MTNKTYCTEVFNVAVEYAAYLCKQFNFDPFGKNVIVSHKEAHALGYGSNHGDPDNWWSRHGFTMDKFRAAVRAKLDESTSPTPSTPGDANFEEGDLVKIVGTKYYTGAVIPSWVKAKNWYVQSVSGNRVVINKSEDGSNSIMSPIHKNDLALVRSASFQPYLVRVTTSNLNIRKGAGDNYAVSGAIKNGGVYTIVEEADGSGASKWGKLKSGAGWISLDYTTKV